MKTLLIQQLQTLNIKVSEPIQSNSLLEFLKTNISQSGKQFSHKGLFYFYYIPENLSYEILLFEEEKGAVPLPFVFSSIAKEGVELFITSQFFCVYRNKSLVFFKNIENTVQEEIVQYVEQLYKIKIDRITLIENQELEKIEQSFLKENSSKNIKFYPISKNYSFFYFMIFCFFLLSIFIVTLWYQYSTAEKNQTKTATKTLQSISLKPYYAVDEVIQFFEFLSFSKIQLEKFRYHEKKLYTKISHPKRKNLLDSLEKYPKKYEIGSLVFDSENNIYIVEVTFEI